MVLPSEYAWIEPVLIASLVVFVVSWLGNKLTLANPIVNAIVTAVIFGLIFGAITYFGYGSVTMTVTTKPSPTAPAQLKKQDQ